MGAEKKSMMKAMHGAPSVGSMRRKKFDFDFSKNFDFLLKSRVTLPKCRKSMLNSRWLARNGQFKVRVCEQTVKERNIKTVRSP